MASDIGLDGDALRARRCWIDEQLEGLSDIDGVASEVDDHHFGRGPALEVIFTDQAIIRIKDLDNLGQPVGTIVDDPPRVSVLVGPQDPPLLSRRTSTALPRRVTTR